jgi:GTP cyclohydrolase I
MYVNEIFAGLHSPSPKITVFPNEENYDQMLVVKDITIFSCCEHHFVPIHGKCHIAYIPQSKVIGLSKLIRVAQHFSAKPQLQERLTQEIGNHLQKVLATDNVALVVEAAHFCCSMRGARDPNSKTVTSFLGGAFKKQELRTEFLSHLK